MIAHKLVFADENLREVFEKLSDKDPVKKAHIGRMAVLAAWRGQGIGSDILHSCIEQCKKLKVNA